MVEQEGGLVPRRRRSPQSETDFSEGANQASGSNSNVNFDRPLSRFGASLPGDDQSHPDGTESHLANRRHRTGGQGGGYHRSQQRKVYTEHDLLKHHVFVPEPPLTEKIKSTVREACEGVDVRQWIRDRFPFLEDVRGYDMNGFIRDVMTGITAFVVLVPQSLAYTVLAGLPISYGLLASFVPPVVYTFVGTSRHVSIGPFALISLVVGQILPTLIDNYDELLANNPDLLGALSVKAAMGLTIVVGLLLLAMSLLQLGWIISFFSKPAIAGFICGSAYVISTSQVGTVFQIKLKPDGSFLDSWITIFSNLPSTNICSLLIGVVSITTLLTLDYITRPPRFKSPLPFPLLIVIVTTAISYLAQFGDKYDLKVVGAISNSFPNPTVPSVPDFGRYIQAAITPAIINFIVTMSTAKQFASEHGYSVSANQELFALGLVAFVSSFFSAFVPASSLSRSAVVNNFKPRSSLWNLVVVALLAICIGGLSPLLHDLPYSALAAIILASFKRLLQRITEPFKLWQASKRDALTWAVVFFVTLFTNTQYGLITALALSVAALISDISRPTYSFLGRLSGTRLYRDIVKYPMAKTVPEVLVFRFDAHLHFANHEYFSDVLNRAIAKKLQHQEEERQKLSEMGGDDISMRVFVRQESRQPHRSSKHKKSKADDNRANGINGHPTSNSLPVKTKTGLTIDQLETVPEIASPPANHASPASTTSSSSSCASSSSVTALIALNDSIPSLAIEIPNTYPLVEANASSKALIPLPSSQLEPLPLPSLPKVGSTSDEKDKEGMTSKVGGEDQVEGKKAGRPSVTGEGRPRSQSLDDGMTPRLSPKKRGSDGVEHSTSTRHSRRGTPGRYGEDSGSASGDESDGMTVCIQLEGIESPRMTAHGLPMSPLDRSRAVSYGAGARGRGKSIEYSAALLGSPGSEDELDLLDPTVTDGHRSKSTTTTTAIMTGQNSTALTLRQQRGGMNRMPSTRTRGVSASALTAPASARTLSMEPATSHEQLPPLVATVPSSSTFSAPSSSSSTSSSSATPQPNPSPNTQTSSPGERDETASLASTATSPETATSDSSTANQESQAPQANMSVYSLLASSSAGAPYINNSNVTNEAKNNTCPQCKSIRECRICNPPECATCVECGMESTSKSHLSKPMAMSSDKDMSWCDRPDCVAGLPRYAEENPGREGEEEEGLGWYYGDGPEGSRVERSEETGTLFPEGTTSGQRNENESRRRVSDADSSSSGNEGKSLVQPNAERPITFTMLDKQGSLDSDTGGVEETYPLHSHRHALHHHNYPHHYHRHSHSLHHHHHHHHLTGIPESDLAPLDGLPLSRPPPSLLNLNEGKSQESQLPQQTPQQRMQTLMTVKWKRSLPARLMLAVVVNGIGINSIDTSSMDMLKRFSERDDILLLFAGLKSAVRSMLIKFSGISNVETLIFPDIHDAVVFGRACVRLEQQRRNEEARKQKELERQLGGGGDDEDHHDHDNDHDNENGTGPRSGQEGELEMQQLSRNESDLESGMKKREVSKKKETTLTGRDEEEEAKRDSRNVETSQKGEKEESRRRSESRPAPMDIDPHGIAESLSEI